MASNDAPAPGATSTPESKSAPPIGAGSVETSELDCEIVRESILPKLSTKLSTEGFPQRVLPPPFPPSLAPGYDAKAKCPGLRAFSGAQPDYPFIFHHEEPRRASSGKPSPIDRPHKRKRCSGLTKGDKLALITICAKHKADYKQGDKTGFWDNVRKSMAAETGKELAQPRSMVERWCNWEIDQVLDRQTTDDQQDFRTAVKEFCARWKEVRQEYNIRKQSKANTTEDSVQIWADTSMETGRSNLYGDDIGPGDIKQALYSIAHTKCPDDGLTPSLAPSRKIPKSHTSPSDTTISKLPSTNALVASFSTGNTDNNAYTRSSLDNSTRSSDRPASSPLDSNPPSTRATIRDVPGGNASLEIPVTGNSSAYTSPYRWTQHRGPTAGSEITSIAPSNNTPINKTEIASASLPTPRASISGSQSSTSSPITNMDFRHFPRSMAESTRNPGVDIQSLNRVTSSPIDELAQAYVSRTYEASFDILREIMMKHDEAIRQIQASKGLLEKDIDASKRHLASVEYELDITRRKMKEETAALTAQIKKSQSQHLAAQQLINSLHRQKLEAVLNLQESPQQPQQPQSGKESLEKQIDESNQRNVLPDSEVDISKLAIESTSKKAAIEKELEMCQRQVVKIKNEKSVLELELSVSRRQVQELKAQIPYPIGARGRSRKSHDGTVTLLPKPV